MSENDYELICPRDGAELVDGKCRACLPPPQDRAPNFRERGQLYLVRCFACEPKSERENYAFSVASGKCAWCGWKE